MTPDLDADALASLLGITHATVLDKVRRKQWPHQRYTQRQIRFTADQVKAIREMCQVNPDVKPNPGAAFDRVTRGARP